MKFSVPITGFGDPQHPHSGCFVDYARALVSALRTLGHEVVRPGDVWTPGHPYGRPIVFGAQITASLDVPGDAGSFMPGDAILYNSEQTGARGSDEKLIFDAIQTWRERVIWDYAETNAAALRRLGAKRVVMCPVAYDPVMTRIAPLEPNREDIDVLFYGSLETPIRIAGMRKAGIRVLDRAALLADLRQAGLNVSYQFGVYGTDLDPYIARAKVVLNLHYY